MSERQMWIDGVLTCLGFFLMVLPWLTGIAGVVWLLMLLAVDGRFYEMAVVLILAGVIGAFFTKDM